MQYRVLLKQNYSKLLEWHDNLLNLLYMMNTRKALSHIHINHLLICSYKRPLSHPYSHAHLLSAILYYNEVSESLTDIL